MLVPTNIAHRAVSLLASASLVLCAGTSGHVLAASQDPAAGEPSAVGSEPAAPAPGSAADLSGQAIERFKARDYDAAARLFEQAYGLDPNPNYLFNIGRVYEEKGDLKRAVEYYQRFVNEPGVQIEARERASGRLKVLRAIVDDNQAKPETKPEGPTDDKKPEPLPTEGPQDVADPNKKMKFAGFGLLGLGGVSMIVGGIFGGLALGKQSDLKNTSIISERQSLASSGPTFALVSDVTLFTGAGLAVTGLVLVLVARKRTKAARTALAPSIGRDHAGVVWNVRF